MTQTFLLLDAITNEKTVKLIQLDTITITIHYSLLQKPRAGILLEVDLSVRPESYYYYYPASHTCKFK